MSAQLSDQFELHGEEVLFAEVEAIKKQGMQLIEDAQDSVKVDLANLERANSVTIALLTAWYRHAHLHKKSIVFAYLSEDLRNIIAFSGLTDILPIDQANA